jgi:hypothetical protein
VVVEGFVMVREKKPDRDWKEYNPKSAIEKFGRDFYAFWAFLGIARGILPSLFRETGIHA